MIETHNVTKALKRRSSLRGKGLDETLRRALAEMLAEGHRISPISRSSVMKRLGLNSRATLGGERARLIEEARLQQMHDAGLNLNGSRRRRTPDERVQVLSDQLKKVEKERDHLVQTISAIVSDLQTKGIDVEDALMALRPNREVTTGSR